LEDKKMKNIQSIAATGIPQKIFIKKACHRKMGYYTWIKVDSCIITHFAKDDFCNSPQ